MRTTLITRKEGWIPAAIVAGFAGTAATVVVLFLAYAVAASLAQYLGGVSAQWLNGLTRNPLTQAVQSAMAIAFLLHFTLGILWALCYSAIFEQRLSGPGWQRGMQFSLVPWVLSLVAFFPVVGVGFFGSSLNAGPLPALGNLILHLVYGGIVGLVYEHQDKTLSSAAEDSFSAVDLLANAGAERGTAIGIIAGGILGSVMGLLVGGLLTLVGSQAASPAVLTLVGAVAGVASGALVGSVAGLSTPARR
jgi:hypothetical protein